MTYLSKKLNTHFWSREAMKYLLELFSSKTFRLLSIFLIYFTQLFHSSTSMASQTFIAAVPENFPPHYLVSENGKPEGFAIDTMDDIAELANIRIKYRTYPTWSDVFEAIKAGEADIIPNLGISESRKAWAGFTRPLEAFAITLITRKDSPVQKMQNLQGKPIGVVKGNVGEKLMAKKKGYEIIRFESPNDALIALLSGKIDGWVYPKSVALRIAHRSQLQNRISVTSEPIKEIFRGIAVRNERSELLEKLDSVTDKYILSDRFQETYQKWHGTPAPFWNTEKVSYLISAIVFISIAFGWFFQSRTIKQSNKQLEKRIEERTHELEATAQQLNDKQNLLLQAQTIGRTGHWKWVISKEVLEWSEMIFEILGLDSKSLSPSFDLFMSSIHPDDQKLVEDAVQKALSDMSYTFSIEHRIVQPNGHIHYVVEHGNVIRDTEGNPIEMLGTIQDITAYKLIEKQLLQSKEQAEKATNEIQDKLKELEEFNRMAVGRELKMISLKDEVNSLMTRLGEKPRYDISE